MLTALVLSSLVLSIVWSAIGIASHRRPKYSPTVVLQVPREVFEAIGKEQRRKEEVEVLERAMRL